MTLKTAWHWGSNRSVIHDPLGESGRTPFRTGALWIVTTCFLPVSWDSSITRVSDMNE